MKHNYNSRYLIEVMLEKWAYFPEVILLVAYAGTMHFKVEKKIKTNYHEINLKETDYLSDKIMKAAGSPDFLEKVGCLLPALCVHIKEIIVH